MCMGLPYLPVTAWQALRLLKVAKMPPASPSAAKWPRSFKQDFSYGFPLTLAQFGVAVLQTGDRYIIAPIVSAESLGIYAFWTGMGIQVGRGIFGILFPVVTPRLFQVWGRDQIGAVRNVQALLVVYALVVIPLLAALGYVLPPLLALVGVSDQYAVGRQFIWFGLTAMVLLGVMQLMGKRGEFAGRTMFYAVAALVGSLTMAIVDLVFVPIYGVVAAGYGLVAGFGVALMTMIYQIWYRGVAGIE
jgi:O-antigen/teichoic acid export membrane protein